MRNWWKVRNCNGNVGFVPYTALMVCNYEYEETAYVVGVDSETKSEEDQLETPDRNHSHQDQSLLARQFMAHPLVRRDSLHRSASVPVPPPMPPTPFTSNKPLQANLVMRAAAVKAAGNIN